MSLGNLSIRVNADIAGFTTSMDIASRAAQSSMGTSAESVDDFRARLLKTSEDMQLVARAMGGNMQAANDAIVASANKSVQAIESITETADAVQLKPMGEKIAEAIGAGVGVGIVAAKTSWDQFVEWTKMKAIVTGAVIGAVFTAVGLGAVYTAYKVIDGSLGFIAGLITGDSYKSASIDALIQANDQVKEIQKSLQLTAQQASATNAALASLGVSKSDYADVFNASAAAVRKNTEELDRLGVAYKDAKGNALPLEEVIKNAAKVLDEYTEGWDRNQAASALGLGSASQVAAAALVTGSTIAEAHDRLNDYNLGIGEDSQAAVQRYEDAMRAFNRETELTASGFQRAWADQIMPVLTDLAEFFKSGFPFAVNVFRYSMATVTSLFYGLKTVAYMVSESVVGSISAIGSSLGGVATAGMKVLTGDFSGAKDALVSGWNDAKARLGSISDNIVAQARHNADAMRQAWALDDRADPVAPKKNGKTWTPKPDTEEPDTGAVQPLDDVAKRVMEGQLKAQEEFIADEKTQLQTRQEFLRHYYSEDAITAKDYYGTRQQLIADNLASTLAAYDKEIEAVRAYIEIHKKESDKKADIVAAENRIEEIKHKRAQAEIQTNKDIALSYMELSTERAQIAQSLLKADAIEDKAHQHRLSVLTEFRDAQLSNAIEGNRLIEEETKRHNQALRDMQDSNDMQALSQAQSVGDQMLDVLKNSGNEQTALFKAMFLVNKAIAVAEIIINTESGAAKALGMGPFGIPMASIIRGLGYASAGIVAGTAIAQASAEGGYDIPAGVNPVTQLHAKEMVLPKEQADVIRGLATNGRAGAGGEMQLTIVNQTSASIGKVIEQRISPTERALIIQEAKRSYSSDLADPNSGASRAMARHFNTSRSR